MKVETINLSSLPENWRRLAQKETEETILSSEDPVIDGTSMTVNKDLKYRRKRIVSKVKPYKRTYKIQELLNYCKFKVGLIPTCEKPPKMVAKVLTDYKYHRLDEIPKAYLEIIELNKELVENAININLRGLKKTTKTKKAKKTMPKINKNSLKAKERAEQWIEKVKQNDKDALANYTYVVHFINWTKNHKMPKMIKEVFDNNKELLQNYTMKNTRLVNTKYVTTEDTKKINMTPITLPEQTIKVVDAIPDYSTTIKAEDALSMMIMLAKKAGATELVIKL